MTLKVQYHNCVYDMISADILQRLIVNGKIKKFYHYSEKKWITVEQDHMGFYDSCRKLLRTA